MLKRMAIFILMLHMILVSSGCESIAPSAEQHTEIYINEVVTSNARSLVEDDLGSPDWIELYNASPYRVNLEGYTLTDNFKNPVKWTFPSVTIEAEGYLVVYASKLEGALCTGFGLSKDGDMLYFSDQYYALVQEVTIPPLITDVSYARRGDGTYGYCATPTPGEANATEIVDSRDELNFASEGQALMISEIVPENDGSYIDGFGGTYAWCELENVSDASVLLSEYYLSDDPTNAKKWHLPAMNLAPGDHIVVVFSGRDDASGELHASFRLGSDDLSLLLCDNQGAICDELSWPASLPNDVSVLHDGLFSAFPTPAAVNSSRTFTSASDTPMDATDAIVINEVLVNNGYSIRDGYGDRSPWVELYNRGNETVSLGGYYLSDDALNPYKFALPAGSSLAPGQYLVVFLSGREALEGELHASFSLSPSDGAIILANKDGRRVACVEIDPAIGDNVSMGTGSNGSLQYFTTPTPGAPNSTHGFDALQDVVLTDINGVYISEVASSSAVKSGEADWIELYNGSEKSVNLKGWRISDDVDDPNRFEIPSLTIPAGGYAVINATTRTAKRTGVCAPFGISESGETLILTDDCGDIVDFFSTGALTNGVTSGRQEGDASASRVFFASPTKNKPNAKTAYGRFAAEPVFSNIDLYHKDAFQLTLTCPTPDAEIRYTLDGSIPTAASTRYTGPIAIRANTPVRAVALCDGMLASDVVTMTYLFSEPHTLPVVCISADEDDFRAMYAVIDRWNKIEREGHFAFYESGGKLGAAFPCGLRASGASTLLAAQKSMTVFLRAGYGQSETSYPFFPGNDVSSYSSLVLRNSGQDRDKARLRDSFCMKAVEGLNIESVETRLAIVYVNGAYYGIYDLNENQNEDYLASHYGADPDAVDIIRRNETPLEGSRYEFKRVREYALNRNTSSDSAYAELSQWVDVDYFIDYLIAQTYFSNGDMFNQKYWRSQDYAVKWRPVYYDLDLALGSSSPTRNVLPQYFIAAGVPSQDGSLTNMDIFVGLRRNKEWCDAFCKRYVYVVVNYFNADRLTSILDEMAAALRPEMARHIARWHAPNSMSTWEKYVAELRACLKKRPEYALESLQREFSLTDQQMHEYIEAASVKP